MLGDRVKSDIICVMYVVLSLGLWCLTPLSTIFQLYRGSRYYRGRKPKYLEFFLSNNIVSSTPLQEWDSNSQL
jgi:hypothetical protein